MIREKNYSPEGLAQRLKILCLKSGLTQTQIGAHVGTNRTTIYRWTEGTRTPDITSLARLCKLFGVSADYLLFGKEDN